MRREKAEEGYFRELCGEYLNRLGIVDLRAYGRFLNLSAPTRLKKSESIFEILEVLCGQKKTVRTRKGAPIKNDSFQIDIPLRIEEIRKRALNGETEKVSVIENRKKNLEINMARLQLSLDIDTLSNQQKQLLIDFLKSL